MSNIFNQLSDHKEDSKDGPPPESRDAPPKPDSNLQLDLGLSGISSAAPLSRPEPVRRARQPAVVPAPADESAPRDLQAKLADARAALARNEETLTSVRRELAEESEAHRHAAAREHELNELLLAARLHGPQIAPILFGRSRKMQVWIKIVAIASVAVLMLGLGALLFSRHQGRPSGDSQAAVDALPGVASVSVAAHALIKPHPGPFPVRAGAGTAGSSISSVSAAAHSVVLPAIELKGLQAKPVDGGLQIVFDKGVFRRRAILSDEAGVLLKQLAGQLRSAMSTCRLQITGHTDPEPIRDGAIPDNRALGLQRARTVAEYFTTKCSLPADAMSVVSAGDANAPYPNTTPELRRKNRTVTIIVTPR